MKKEGVKISKKKRLHMQRETIGYLQEELDGAHTEAYDARRTLVVLSRAVGLVAVGAGVTACLKWVFRR